MTPPTDYTKLLVNPYYATPTGATAPTTTYDPSIYSGLNTSDKVYVNTGATNTSSGTSYPIVGSNSFSSAYPTTFNYLQGLITNPPQIGSSPTAASLVNTFYQQPTPLSAPSPINWGQITNTPQMTPSYVQGVGDINAPQIGGIQPIQWNNMAGVNPIYAPLMQGFDPLSAPGSMANEFAQFGPQYATGKGQNYYDTMKSQLRDSLRNEFFGPLGTVQQVGSAESAAGRLGSGVSERVIQEAAIKPYLSSFMQIDQQVSQLQAEEQAQIQQFNAEQYNQYVDRLSSLRQADVANQMNTQQFNASQLLDVQKTNVNNLFQAAQFNANMISELQKANAQGQLSADQANQLAQIQVAQTNVQSLMEALKANQSAQLQVQSLNQAADLQAQQQNLESQLRVALANQQTQFQASQLDQQAQMQTQQFNANLQAQFMELAYQAAQAEAGRLSQVQIAQLESNMHVWETALTQYTQEQQIMSQAQSSYNDYLAEIAKVNQAYYQSYIDKLRVQAELANSTLKGASPEQVAYWQQTANQLG